MIALPRLRTLRAVSTLNACISLATAWAVSSRCAPVWKGLSTTGRVVCLGSPLNGSRAAQALVDNRWGSVVAGQALIEATITEPASKWASDVARRRDVGVVAGSQSAGLGRVFARFEEPNDGTVAVSETQLEGTKDHIVLPVSHSGMVFSSEVADQAAAFLRRGEFLRED